MLVLSRKAGDRIVIGDNIVVTINRVQGQRVSVGVEAPRAVKVVRGELDAIPNLGVHDSKGVASLIRSVAS